MLVSILALLTGQVAPGPTHTPDASNYRDYLTFIQPSADEQKYKEIGWRQSLAEAIPEAKALGRPILLWTMNGHPLGCT